MLLGARYKPSVPIRVIRGQSLFAFSRLIRAMELQGVGGVEFPFSVVPIRVKIKRWRRTEQGVLLGPAQEWQGPTRPFAVMLDSAQYGGFLRTRANRRAFAGPVSSVQTDRSQA